ncbi:TolC family protein [Paraflavisolibacter sp. H34]|uniref:TolC family protein n=1 Tax=Huijunlia imazamoxiresistens TaxID=3127457 RepID=UPI00301A345F
MYKAIWMGGIALSLAGFAARAQNLDTVLAAIGRNNKAIGANKKYWEARLAEYRTGLTPYDPLVEFDYLPGSPAGAGTQRDFALTQRLDFPTAYKRKKELAGAQAEGAGLEQAVFRQDVLLEAKLTALQLIAVNKKAAVLEQRLRRTARLAEDYQKKLDRGEVIVLDVNKARLQLLQVNQEAALNLSERQALLTRLSEFNGGLPVELRDTLYPQEPSLPDFDILDSLIEAADPRIRSSEQQQEVLRRQVGVQKALNLPKLEAGYHSQGILGQSYRGGHAGLTLPLWENKNRLKAVQAELEHSWESAGALRLEHRLEHRRLYDQLAVRTKAMQEYNALVAGLNNTYLLEKALRLGQITVISYFQEESYYFSAYDRYLQQELEYHQALARLLKYRLSL